MNTKTRPIYMLGGHISELLFLWQYTHILKVRGWIKIFHTNGNQKKAGVAIPISDKSDFKIKTVQRDKEGHYIMIKGSIQKDKIILNIYVPNIGLPDGASGKKPNQTKNPVSQCRRYKRCSFDLWAKKIPWMKAWQLTQEFLPRESHGQRCTSGYSP